MIKSYKDLNVWQVRRELVADIYSLTRKLPADEIYGLSSQMRRSSVSIPSNIAEGFKRNNKKEYIQFLGIALGSSAELETQLILVQDVYTIDTTSLQSKVIDIQRMLAALKRKVTESM